MSQRQLSVKYGDTYVDVYVNFPEHASMHKGDPIRRSYEPQDNYEIDGIECLVVETAVHGIVITPVYVYDEKRFPDIGPFRTAREALTHLIVRSKL